MNKIGNTEYTDEDLRVLTAGVLNDWNTSNEDGSDRKDKISVDDLAQKYMVNVAEIIKIILHQD